MTTLALKFKKNMIVSKIRGPMPRRRDRELLVGGRVSGFCWSYVFKKIKSVVVLKFI